MPGQCFYIPAYQREYAWKKQNVIDLLEDIFHGLSAFCDQDEAITFIGSLITIRDTAHKTIMPQVANEVPARVLLVIDGQQRLTTVMILAAQLWRDLSRIRKNINQIEDPTIKGWFDLQINTTLALLSSLLFEKMPSGEREADYYPRMIRAYKDQWSFQPTTFRYKSGIAFFLKNFIQESKFKQEPQEHEETAEFKFFSDNTKEIKRFIKDFIKAEEANDERFALNHSYFFGKENENLQTTLVNGLFPAGLQSLLDQSPSAAGVFKLIMFARYLLERVAFTHVTVDNETYAFEIFESLNTTGEPLTAFETFKPKVIEKEGLERFESTLSKKYIDQIEAFIFGPKDEVAYKERQTATTGLLINFALMYDGTKLSKRLEDQRQYLKTNFEKQTTQELREQFLEGMARLSEFTSIINDDGKLRAFIDSKKFSRPSEIYFCLTLLKDAGHTITYPILALFYLKMEKTPGDEAVAIFESAAKALVSFFVIWRSSRSGTAGIDSCYRSIAKEGIPELNIQGFNIQSGKIDNLNSLSLVSALKSMLKSDRKYPIRTKDDWIKMAAETDTYENGSPISKAVLLLAHQDTVFTNESSCFMERGTKGSYDLFSSLLANNEFTVEHVAPQKPNPDSDWSKVYQSIYEQRAYDRIGNLTFLPLVENAVLGNRPWKEKKKIYEILSTPALADFKRKLMDFGFSETVVNTLEESNHLSHLKSIASVSDWNEEYINKRGEIIADLVWNRLSPWLDLDSL